MKKNKDRQGSTLILVVVIFTIVIIIGTTITTLVLKNAHSTKLQRQQMQAYYVALGGLEIGSSALLKLGVKDGEQVPELLDDFLENPKKSEIVDTVSFNNSTNDEVEIRIKATGEKGNPLPADASSKEIWVQVYAKGTAFDAENRPMEHAGRIRFKADNPSQYFRDIKMPID